MRKQIEVPAKIESFEEVRNFIEERLKIEHVADELINENILVVEEVFVRIIENYDVDNETISICVSEMFGEIKVFIRFSGERFIIDFNNGDIFDPGAIILNKYEDKIGLKYRNRINTIRIVARRKFDKIGRWSMFGIALAIAVYAVLNVFLTTEQQHQFDFDWIEPLESMYINAILLVAAPVTFLSLVTNITNVSVMVDDRIQISYLVKKIAKASLTATALAVAYFIALQPLLNWLSGGNPPLNASISLQDAKDIFFSMIPSDFFSAFTDLLPFQLILVGILTAAGVISCNKHFDEIKSIIDSVYALVCRMLGIIMLFLPIAAFLSFMDILLYDGYVELLMCLTLILLIAIGMIIMVALKLLFMKFRGVPTREVIRKLWPAVIENIRINSPIDAVPYNTRFCNKEFGVKIDKLDLELPIFAQISLGGNCFIISLVSMMLYQYAGMTLGPIEIAIMVLIVLGLSLGAPNQAGSVLIGLIIMAKFMNIDIAFMCTVIYCEVFFSRAVSVLNALSDISSEIIDAYAEEKSERNNI